MFKRAFPPLFFLIFSVLALLFSCTPLSRNWLSTAEIKNPSFYNTAGTDYFEVELTGYPPFTVEVWDNPRFEGTRIGSVRVEETGSIDLAGLNSGLMGSLVYQSFFYLRIKSDYGNWVPYSVDGGNPRVLVYRDTGFPADDVNTPVFLSTPQDLIDLANKDSRFLPAVGGVWNRHYVLTNDIDLTGYSWLPIGNNGEFFAGSFDGAGHVISGIEEFGPPDNEVMGFFYGISGAAAEVKNLGLKLGNIENLSSSLGTFGGLTGVMDGYSNISNCYVVGEKIKGGRFTGGLVGKINNGIIRNCYTDITVEGQIFVGGLFSYVEPFGTTNIVVTDSYAAGDVFSYSDTSGYIGGFYGIGAGSVGNPQRCVVLNSRIENRPGAIGVISYFGSNTESTNLDYTYYNKYVFSPGGTPLYRTGGGQYEYSLPINPYTMNRNTPPFNQWDFNEIWEWEDSKNRPVLRTVRQ